LFISDSDLIEDWDWARNPLDPKTVRVFSNKKCWWVCKFNHSWLAAPSNRSSGRGCRECRRSKDPEVIKENLKKRHGITEEWLEENYVNSSNSFEDILKIFGIGHTVVRKGLRVYSLSKDKTLIKDSKNKKRDSTNIERYGSSNPHNFARNKKSSFESEIESLLGKIIEEKLNKEKSLLFRSELKSRLRFEYSNIEIIEPKELDFYFPELKLAIEFNGNYWHDFDLWSSDVKNGTFNSKERIKTKLCEEKEVKLFHIWECEWVALTVDDKRELLEEILEYKKKECENVQISPLQ